MTGTEVERILVRLVGDPTLYIKALKEASMATVTFVQRIKAMLRQVSTLAFGLAAAAVTGFFKKAIGAAANAEQIMSKFFVVFKNQAKEAQNFSQELAVAANRSQTQLMKYMSDFQDLFVPFGFSRKEAMAISKDLTQLTLDLASFNNYTEDEVFVALQAAMTGSGEVMKRYGVIVNETTIKQEALNQNMDPKHLTEMQKVMLRMAIIMKGTTDAQGDATRTAGEATNQFVGFRATMEEFTVTMGNQLLPTITAITGGLSAFVKTFLDGFNLLNGTTKQLITSLAALMIVITALQKGLALVGIEIGGIGAALNLLKAHPIIAIIAAFVALVTWLNKSKVGGEGLIQTFRDAGIEIGKMTGQVKILNEELLKTDRIQNERAVGGIEEEIIRQRKKMLEAQSELKKFGNPTSEMEKGAVLTMKEDIERAKAAIAELEKAKAKISGGFTGGSSLTESGLGYLRGIMGDNFLKGNDKDKSPFERMKGSAIDFAQRGLKPIMDMNERIKANIEEQAKVWQGMASQAHQIMMDQLTPIEKLRAELDDIDKLVRIGALTKEAGDKAKQNMVGQFAQQGGTSRHTAGAAIEAGTREAYSLTRFGTHQKTTEKGVWELVEKTKVSIKTEQQILAEMQKSNKVPAKLFSIPGG